MSKTTSSPHDTPVHDDLDPEVDAFRQRFDERSPLDEIICERPHNICQLLLPYLTAAVMR